MTEFRVAEGRKAASSSETDHVSSEILVSLNNVGKMYQLFDKPIDRLKYTLFWRLGKAYGREFWALRGVSFDVHHGEAVGILGRNGSGKSTLLQIVAGVLQPTEGNLQISGRVSALLELGSGFNWEYTGRQNVYLSGAILGFSKEQMEARFDDIAAFADIGAFMDQPVKHYSSGMFARLAFSVAIFVDPDILVVDEILAVGDYEFQQKCAARMRQMRDNGLTLLYVSHSTDTVKDVCDRGLFLNEGQIKFWGTAEDAADRYLQFVREKKWEKQAVARQNDQAALAEFANNSAALRYGSGAARITGVEITGEDNQPAGDFYLDDVICIHVSFVALEEIEHFSAGFAIRDNNGISVMGATTFDDRVFIPELKAGDTGKVVFRFKNQLRHGNYGVFLGLNSVSDREYIDNIELDWLGNAATFQVLHNPERPVWQKFYCPTEIQVELDRPK